MTLLLNILNSFRFNKVSSVFRSWEDEKKNYHPREDGRSYHPWEDGRSYHPWEDGRSYHPWEDWDSYHLWEDEKFVISAGGWEVQVTASFVPWTFMWRIVTIIASYLLCRITMSSLSYKPIRI